MLSQYLPQKSRLIIHNPSSWNDFLNSRNSNQDLGGTYLPRTLTAHLKEENSFLEINKFHEFNGHGSFCEHSIIGKRIVQYEQELVEIEKHILGVKDLPENHHFQLTHDDPFFRQYYLLRNEFDGFFRKHHNYYEGFAYWLEKHLSLESSFRELYQLREQNIAPFYLELVVSFEKFVSHNSISALFNKMQFE